MAVAKMTATLLSTAKPPVTPEQVRKMIACLDSPQLRGISAQIEAVVGDENLKNAKDAKNAAGLAIRIQGTASALADVLRGLNTAPLPGKMQLAAVQAPVRNAIRDDVSLPWTAPRQSLVPLSAVPVQVRDAVRQVAPVLAEALENAHPAHPAFPAPAYPEALPTNKAARRQFLINELAHYRAKERVAPERGVSTHGRGHIARAYIYANVFCNILAEQGLKVDRNAVILGIIGHDLERRGLGKDRWEKQSAERTVQDINAQYGPEAMGQEYSNELNNCIVKVQVAGPNGRTIDVPKSSTLEAQLLNAADCLDIGRTDDFDPSYFEFLRDKNGQISPDAQKLRDQLIEEADLLQRLTNPKCATKQAVKHIVELIFDEQDVDICQKLQKQKDDIDAENSAKLIQETETVEDEAFFSKIEDTIRQNPSLFPLFTQYYLNAD